MTRRATRAPAIAACRARRRAPRRRCRRGVMRWRVVAAAARSAPAGDDADGDRAARWPSSWRGSSACRAARDVAPLPRGAGADDGDDERRAAGAGARRGARANLRRAAAAGGERCRGGRARPRRASSSSAQRVDARVTAAWGEPATRSDRPALRDRCATVADERPRARVSDDGGRRGALPRRRRRSRAADRDLCGAARGRAATGPARLSQFVQQLVGVQAARATAPLPVQALVAARARAARDAAAPSDCDERRAIARARAGRADGARRR